MADKYWVGGGSSTNWNATAPTNWALSSGGAGNQTIPQTGDRVFFDANSGTGASVWQTAISLTGLDCTGSKNPVTHASVALTLSAGNLVLPTGVGGTYTGGGTFSFTATSGTQQVNTGAYSVGSCTFNGSGGTFQLLSNLLMTISSTATTWTLTAGTFDTNAFSVTAALWVMSGSGTRVVTGSGSFNAINTNGSGATVVNFNSTNTTVSGWTGAFNISGAHDGYFGYGFSTAGVTWPALTIAGNSGQGAIVLTAASTFTSITVTGQNTIVLPNATTITSATILFTGTPADPILLDNSSNTVVGSATLSCSGTARFRYTGFRDITISGAGVFTANPCWDHGHNSGFTIIAPVIQGSHAGMESIEHGMYP